MRGMLRIAGFLFFMFLPALASTSNKFSESPTRVASAAKKSIEANGIITSQDDAGTGFFFAAAKTWGHVSVTPTEGGTVVEITTGDGHGRGSEKAIMNGIAADLAGREVKVNKKWIDQAQKMERRRASLASAQQQQQPSGPATILISADRESVKSALLSECASRGFIVTGESDHQITVAKESAAPLNLLGSILVNPNATIKKYRANIQFLLTGENAAIRVTPMAELIAVDGYGRAASQMVTGDPQVRSALQFILDAAKARLEQQPAK